MPTNEERRAIASAMREEAQKWERVNPEGWFYSVYYIDTILQDLVRFAGIEGSVKTSELFSRFADLIEPEPERTCKAEQDYDAMEDGVPDCRIWRCSCGEAFPYWRGGKPIFCPNCGAKVIGG